MTEFWESSFQSKQAMWGHGPADSAIAAAELFKRKGLTKVLVPGFGYGRNAQVFTKNGCVVTGIEISETAIGIAREEFGESTVVHHGSVSEMPFDQNIYDGVFCYALIHLLEEKDRQKLIGDCYNQLRRGGYMIFVAISTCDNSYGKGELLNANRYLSNHGVKLFYYDSTSVAKEFGKYGLREAVEVSEPKEALDEKQSQRFMYIVCKKMD